MKKCTQCSATFEKGSFCGKCGAKLEDINNPFFGVDDLDKTVAVDDYQNPGVAIENENKTVAIPEVSAPVVLAPQVAYDDEKTVAVIDYSAPIEPSAPEQEVEQKAEEEVEKSFVAPAPPVVLDSEKTVAVPDYAAPIEPSAPEQEQKAEETASESFVAPVPPVVLDSEKTVAVPDYAAPFEPSTPEQEDKAEETASESFVAPVPPVVLDSEKTVAVPDYAAPFEPSVQPQADENATQSVAQPVSDDYLAQFAPQGQQLPVYNEVDKSSKRRKKRGVTQTLDYSHVESQYEAEVYSADIATSYQPQSEYKKKSKKPIVVFLVVLLSVLLLSGVAVAGLLTNWFGFGSPINSLLKSMDKTVHADNMTVKKSVTIVEDGATTDEVETIKYNFDGDLSYIAQGDDYKVCLRDGYQYFVYDNEDREPRKVKSDETDVHKDVDSWLTKDGIDYKVAIEKAGHEKDIKAKEFETFINESYKTYLCDKKWLEKYAGFEKSNKEYVFTPDLQVLCPELVRIIKKSNAFTDDYKDSLVQSIEDYAQDAKKHKKTIKVSFTVKAGKLSNVLICVDDEHKNRQVNYAISDVNKTEVSVAEIDGMIGQYDAYIAEHSCGECGEFVHDQNIEFHGSCTDCGTHGDINAEGLCNKCIDKEKEKCAECGKETKTYKYDGKQLCKKCQEAAKEKDDKDKDKKEKDEKEDFCDKCGSYEELYYYSNGYYCWDCYYAKKYPDDYEDPKYRCEWCGTKEYYSDMWYYDDYLLCWDCYYDAHYSEDYYYTCDWCYDDVEDVYYYGGDYLCWDCYYDANYSYDYCDWCGSYCDYYDLYYYNGDDLCWDCYNEAYYGNDYGYCARCGAYEDMHEWKGNIIAGIVTG